MIIYLLILSNVIAIAGGIAIHFYHLRREGKLIDRLLERNDIIPLEEAPRGQPDDKGQMPPRKLRFKIG